MFLWKEAVRTPGTPGPIRTDDPRIRSPMLYPAELRAHFANPSEGTREGFYSGHSLMSSSLFMKRFAFCQPGRNGAR